MKKRYILFLILIFALFGCGTDYILSSFYLRKDFGWLKPASEQANLNDEQFVIGGYEFNKNNSPVVLATKDNYMLLIYEYRRAANNNLIGVDGSQTVNINIAISKNAYNFTVDNRVVGDEGLIPTKSHGAPVVFYNNSDNSIVVLSTTGKPGYGTGGTADEITKLSYSISTNNGYNWTEWVDIDTNIFKPLTDIGIKRFYTNPGNGLTLNNGALVCMVDYKFVGNSKSQGAAIIYSVNKGKDWQLGATMEYTGAADGKRFARVVAERLDGSLLIAAVHDSSGGDQFNDSGSLYWAVLPNLQKGGVINTLQVSGLPDNDGVNVSVGRIKFTHRNQSYNGLVIAHSTPNRVYKHPQLGNQYVTNALSISISKDDGASWTLIKKNFGVPDNKTSFRKSLQVLKDGSITVVNEEPNALGVTANLGYDIIYRRFGLAAISGGDYYYEGL